MQCSLQVGIIRPKSNYPSNTLSLYDPRPGLPVPCQFQPHHIAVRNFGQPGNKKLSSNLILKFLVVTLMKNTPFLLLKKEVVLRLDASGSRSPPGLPTGPQDPLSAFEMTRLALLKVRKIFQRVEGHFFVLQMFCILKNISAFKGF